MITNTEIRSKARDCLRGKWGTCALAVFIYMVIYMALDYIPYAGSFISLFVIGPFSLSFAIIFLRVFHGEEVKAGMIFEGFNNYGRSFVTGLLYMIYILLWSLLLIVPGIIAYLSYSMVFFILAENPEMSATDALRKSKEMMMGHKNQLILLQLSFLGWIMLGILSLGIGLFWVMSYMETAYAVFYQNLKLEQASEVIAPVVQE